MLASTHCQQIIKIPRTVPRLVGAQWPHPDLHEGEDYACWMATLFSPIHCPCPGACADPMQCRPTLAASSRTKKAAANKPLVHSFAAAWRIHRAEMEGLARRGHAKGNAAKRINVAMDTTICKQWSPEGIVLARTALQRATVYQLFRLRGGTLQCLGRPIDVLL